MSRPPLTVLMVAPGNDLHSVRPLRWLLERGCRVILADPVPPGLGPSDSLLHEPFPLERRRRWLRRCCGGRLTRRLLARPNITAFRRLLDKHRPDAVHVHWIDERAYYCCRAGARPLVLTAWGSDVNHLFGQDANPTVKRWVGHALANADAVIVDADDMRPKCASLAGGPVRTELISLGVDTNRFRPGCTDQAAAWRKRLDIPADAVVFLSIRGWSPLYQHELIARAFAEARPRFRRQAILVFKILRRSSTDRAVYETEMRARVDNFGVTAQVRWMEQVSLEELPGIYAFSDAIVNFPSADAFPVTFLEAAACQCPVLSHRLPAYKGTFAEEYFKLVPTQDVKALAEAMVVAVNGTDSLDRTRLAPARDIVVRDHDEEVVANRLLGLYYQLADRQPAERIATNLLAL